MKKVILFFVCALSLILLTACSKPNLDANNADNVDIVENKGGNIGNDYLNPDDYEGDTHPEDLEAPIEDFVNVFSDFFTTNNFNIVLDNDENFEIKKALVPLTEYDGLMQVTTFYDNGYEYLFQFGRDKFPDANEYVFEIIKTLSQQMEESDKQAVLEGMEKAKENIGTKYYLENFNEAYAYVSVQADENNIYILMT